MQLLIAGFAGVLDNLVIIRRMNLWLNCFHKKKLISY
jgi:hypothetical protein